MKKIILKTLLFIIVCILLDVLIGFILSYLKHHSKSGNTYKMEYMINKINEDVLILGSSRCLHNYNTNIISDSINLSVYNCGIEGTGIIMFYPYIKHTLNRYKPKLIIYDIYDGFDINSGDDNNKYLSPLKPYYTEFKDAFAIVDKRERIKLLSNTYRYNSKIFTIMGDYISSKKSDINGYKPLSGTMKKEPNTNPNKNIVIDSLKIKFLKKLIRDCEYAKVKLIFCISPSYKTNSLQNYSLLFELAQENNILILNHLQDNSYYMSLFYDSVHLNEEGAKKYSITIAKEIKQYMNLSHE